METTETPQKTPGLTPRPAAPAQRPVMDVARPAPIAPATSDKSAVPPAPQQPVPVSQEAPSKPPVPMERPQAAEAPKPVEMHQAPVDEEHSQQPATEKSVPAADPTPPARAHQPAVTAHGPHKPVGLIILIIMAMLSLSGLAILVYLNS